MDRHDSRHFEQKSNNIQKGWNISDYPRSILSKDKVRKLYKRLREKEQLIRDREITIKYLERENEKLKLENDELINKLQKTKRERKSSNIVWLEEESDQDINYKIEKSESIHSSSSSQNAVESEREYYEDDNIDPDQMTYEELLELGERIGVVSRGFTPEQIKLIPIVKYKKNNVESKDDMCSVCQYDYIPGEKLRKLTCIHSFHRRCVDDWLKREKVCPNCKEEVILNEK